MYQKRYYLVNSEQDSIGGHKSIVQEQYQVSGRNNYINDVEFYVNGVSDNSVGYKIINLLYSQWKIKTNDELDKIILEHLKITREKCKTKDEWIECKDKCYTNLSYLVDIELKSTAYFIKTLQKSLISSSNNTKLVLSIGDIDKLTGKWENDQKFINIKSYGYIDSLEKIQDPRRRKEDKLKGRLIMGFGPSASGKTYWAKNIIKMFNEVHDDFPNTFISIDGGIYRETSFVYQSIVKNIKKEEKCAGLANLVLVNFDPTRKSLFNSSIIKNSITKYLTEQKTNYLTPINLYVPITLGSSDCSLSGDCTISYKKYIDLTGDSSGWIGLLIWQHKLLCPYNDSKYKCESCTESGKRREKDEGKKYNNGQWKNSMQRGFKYMLQAPGANIEIHNVGQMKYKEGKTLKPCISTVIDYTDYSSDVIPDKMKNIIVKMNGRYDRVHKPFEFD